MVLNNAIPKHQIGWSAKICENIKRVTKQSNLNYWISKIIVRIEEIIHASTVCAYNLVLLYSTKNVLIKVNSAANISINSQHNIMLAWINLDIANNIPPWANFVKKLFFLAIRSWRWFWKFSFRNEYALAGSSMWKQPYKLYCISGINC